MTRFFSGALGLSTLRSLAWAGLLCLVGGLFSAAVWAATLSQSDEPCIGPCDSPEVAPAADSKQIFDPEPEAQRVLTAPPSYDPAAPGGLYHSAPEDAGDPEAPLPPLTVAPR